MFNTIINSPYVIGAALSMIHLIHRGLTGTFAMVMGTILPLAFIAFYTYFTKRSFTKNFKYLAILTTFIVGFVLQELLFGAISKAFKNFGNFHPGAVIITVTLTVLVGCLINYLYLTFGNKLGLWLLKKNK